MSLSWKHILVDSGGNGQRKIRECCWDDRRGVLSEDKFLHFTIWPIAALEEMTTFGPCQGLYFRCYFQCESW